MKSLYLVLLLPLQLVAQSYSGNVPKDFKASLTHVQNPTSINEIGQLEIEVQYPSDYLREELQKDAEASNQVHFAYQPAERTEENELHVKEKLQIEYEPLSEGVHPLDLPVIEFVSKGEPTHRHTLYPPSIECEVKMVQEDPVEDMQKVTPLSLDARPQLEMDYSNKKVFFQKSEKDLQKIHQRFITQAPSMKWKWFMWAFAMSFIAYKAFQLLSRRKTLKNIFSMNQESPKERALRELKHLKAKNLPEKGQYDAFYVEITQIVRRYIEGYYQIKAPEQTTQEFLQVVLGQSIFNEQINHYLTEFLKFADLVKFARLNPNDTDCHQAEEAAQSFILSESDS